MIGILIKKFRIQLHTASGDYGFECKFEKGLNIVRGDNSSGKSTFINAFIYSLGMEEIIGGKGAKVLPYALKEYVENASKEKIKVISSYVYIEISNKSFKRITLKRAISSDTKNTKLIEVIHGGYLSDTKKNYDVSSRYLHDKGSAQNNSAGFFSFIEDFMNLKLPKVASSSGGDIKLYLQTILSALLIEQKRGWTDYIANTPYYAIRDVRTKIVEFLLGLDVFENDRMKTSLTSEISQLQSKWSEEKCKIGLIEEGTSISVTGIRKNVDDVFDSRLIGVMKLSNDVRIPIDKYIVDTIKKIESIDKAGEKNIENVSIDLIESYRNSKNILDQLISAFDSANVQLRLAKTRLQEYQTTKDGLDKDLEKNKIAQKLKRFGAEQNIEIARDTCPTCHQHIDDSLLLVEMDVKPMSIEENVNYLDSQKKMVARYIVGLEKTVKTLESQASSFAEEVADNRKICLSLKKDMRTSGSASEADIRLKIQLENKVDSLTKASENVSTSLASLERISSEYKVAKAGLAGLHDKKLSENDIEKYNMFQHMFRQYAGIFGYKSAPTVDIEINKDSLLPYLAGLELREVNTDIKSDSSASDFVRLIWAYLLSIFSVSNTLGGNHLGILILDEPAQHSMAVRSMNELLKTISRQSNLQNIVAASFDESDEIFQKSVEGVEYNLIGFGDRLLCPTK